MLSLLLWMSPPLLQLLLFKWVCSTIICIYIISHITRPLKMCNKFYVLRARKFNSKWLDSSDKMHTKHEMSRLNLLFAFPDWYAAVVVVMVVMVVGWFVILPYKQTYPLPSPTHSLHYKKKLFRYFRFYFYFYYDCNSNFLEIKWLFTFITTVMKT